MHEGINDIIILLDDGRLKEALTQLRAIATQTNRWELQNRIENTLTAYGYMLQYVAQGLEDPAREDFFRQTLRTAYELTEQTDIALKAQKTSGLFYDRIRTFDLQPPKTYAEMQLTLEACTEDMSTAPLLYPDEKRRRTETERIGQLREETLTELFDKTWTTVAWTDTEAGEANALLHSVLVNTDDLAVMVSAATLSLLRAFDAAKLSFLLEAYRHDHPQVNQRAIAGLVIALSKHERRIRLYPALQARLALLAGEDGFRRNLYTVQMQLLITRETQEIDRKMREEIIPEMMKNTRQMNDSKFRFNEPEDGEDRNPEWEEWMDKSGMTDKLREMGEWQMAGADVYMSSFAQLKHYPFFHRMSHWFYPFDLNRPELAPLQKESADTPCSMIRLIAQSDAFCNSDKYSFCLAMLHMPQAMRQLSLQQLEEQVQAAGGRPDPTAGTEPKNISRQYIQDLYRFFKLRMRHAEEEDIFRWKFNLWENDCLKEALLQDDTLKKLADYLMQKEYTDEAYGLYRRLMERGEKRAEVYQKAGYIRQKQKDFDGAIRHYGHADLLAPDNLWTNKHLAQCHKLAGHPEEALKYYRKAEAAQPDNLNVALQIGQCLAQLHRYDEALAYFYKVEYLEKKPDNARRAIAWCSFLVGKYDEARKYYRLLLEQPSPKPADRINAGHVELVTRQTAAAMEHYRRAREAFASHTDFIAAFNEDKSTLLKHGLTESALLIFLDALV